MLISRFVRVQILIQIPLKNLIIIGFYRYNEFLEVDLLV